MSAMIKILLTRCQRYDMRVLKDSLESICAHLGLPPTLTGQKILLKPNLISGHGSYLSCTSGYLLAALAELFSDHGAHILLGDSPAFGSAESVLKKRKIESLISRFDIELVEFITPVKMVLAHDFTITVSAEALACDLFVNIPKIKAHKQMFITCAVKNLFGIVLGMRKALAHLKHGSTHLRFADLMLDLIALLPANISIADGIEAMHRDGPIGGDQLDLGCLAGADDPVAMDTAILQLLELDMNKAPIWQAAARRDMPGSKVDNLIYPLRKPEEFHGSGFIAPDILYPVPFNPARFMLSSARRIFHAAHR
ncbi:MAG: DUF362 domain-containing protein [Deltaproteobacteria bacterium]|nr:DUF362 domain-containing protein [Deltaproteobacteria bacterium]